jgi:hypothetical protein
MRLGRIGYVLAVVAVLCVLAVFFFPGVEGPYSAVNGPVTALLSARAAAGLRMAMVHAGSSALLWLGCVLAMIAWASGWITDFQAARLSIARPTILRC